MENLLTDNWYYEPPIDFEHKQYMLFAYLKTVDEAFYNNIFSPYLLHTEKLMEEMSVSARNIKSFSSKISQRRLVMSWEGLYPLKIQPRIEELDIVVEIIEFAVPLLSQRVDLGNRLHRKHPKLLY